MVLLEAAFLFCWMAGPSLLELAQYTVSETAQTVRSFAPPPPHNSVSDICCSASEACCTDYGSSEVSHADCWRPPGSEHGGGHQPIVKCDRGKGDA